jgi:hypothetical protein
VTIGKPHSLFTVLRLTAIYLADRLEFFILFIIACQKKPSIAPGTLTGAVITTDNDQVKGVSNTLQVVLLQLSTTPNKLLIYHTGSIQTF